jgi:poly(3-hydroxybutyrate) depolymerase
MSNASGDGTVAPLAETLAPADWWVVGPFQFQREGEIDWLHPEGGEPAFADGERTPDDGQRFQSALAAGATVGWRAATAEGGDLALDVVDVLDPTGGGVAALTGEDSIASWYGSGAVSTGVCYAWTTVDCEEPRRAVLETGARVVWVNGRRHEDGESEGRSNASSTPPGLVLREGENVVLVKQYVDTAEGGSVSLSFRPPRGPVELNFLDEFRGSPQNAILPDLVAGEATDAPVSVRVTNTTAVEQDATLIVGGEHPYAERVETALDPPLAPHETRRVRTRLVTDTVPESTVTEGEDGDADPEGEDPAAAAETVRATVACEGATDGQDLPLTVRAPEDPRRRITFVSEADGSVQECSVVEPESDEGPHGVVLSLHGSRVPSVNQAGATDQREDHVVCAAAARGPRNHNHDGLGRVDDIEALETVMERFDVDEDRVVVAGHSMGGHGTWHVGTTHAGRFAGLSPSAGYLEIMRYITAPFERATLYGDPPTAAVRNRALQKLLALPKAETMADGTLPAFVLHGGVDEDVNVVQSRTFARGLANLGLDVRGEVGERYPGPDPGTVDVAYLEVPGAEHWWDYGISDGGADAVNHPDRWAFLAACERPDLPERVRLVTSNLRVENAKRWVTVREQVRVHRRTVVDAERTDDGVALETVNVGVLELDAAAVPEVERPVVRVGTETAAVPEGDGPVFVDLRDGGLAVDRSDPRETGGLYKSAAQYGPYEEVKLAPYRFVYGTQGSEAETALAREIALLEQRRRADGDRSSGAVVPDTAVDPATMAEYNCYLVGRPDSNAVLDDLAAEFPLEVGDGTVTVGEHTYRGDLGVQFVYPNPAVPDRLVGVVTGTSEAGLALTRLDAGEPAGRRPGAHPDYWVYDETVRFRGWNGCRAAGFFDKRWRLDSALGAFERRR